MAKKKQPDGEANDRHKSTLHVRLPEAYHALLKQLASEHDRPMSRELLRALDAHFRAHGKTPPAAE